MFGFLSDPTNLTRWQPSVEEVRKGWHGKKTSGLHFTETRRFLGRKVEPTVNVAMYEPSRNLTIKVVSNSVSMTVEYLLTETNGATEITASVEGRPELLLQAASVLAVRTAKHQAEQDFDRLKRLLETPSMDASSATQSSRPRSE